MPGQEIPILNGSLIPQKKAINTAEGKLSDAPIKAWMASAEEGLNALKSFQKGYQGMMEMKKYVKDLDDQIRANNIINDTFDDLNTFKQAFLNTKNEETAEKENEFRTSVRSRATKAYQALDKLGNREVAEAGKQKLAQYCMDYKQVINQHVFNEDFKVKDNTLKKAIEEDQQNLALYFMNYDMNNMSSKAKQAYGMSQDADIPYDLLINYMKKDLKAAFRTKVGDIMKNVASRRLLNGELSSATPEKIEADGRAEYEKHFETATAQLINRTNFDEQMLGNNLAMELLNDEEKNLPSEYLYKKRREIDTRSLRLLAERNPEIFMDNNGKLSNQMVQDVSTGYFYSGREKIDIDWSDQFKLKGFEKGKGVALNLAPEERYAVVDDYFKKKQAGVTLKETELQESFSTRLNTMLKTRWGGIMDLTGASSKEQKEFQAKNMAMTSTTSLLDLYSQIQGYRDGYNIILDENGNALNNNQLSYQQEQQLLNEGRSKGTEYHIVRVHANNELINKVEDNVINELNSRLSNGKIEQEAGIILSKNYDVNEVSSLLPYMLMLGGAKSDLKKQEFTDLLAQGDIETISNKIKSYIANNSFVPGADNPMDFTVENFISMKKAFLKAVETTTVNNNGVIEKLNKNKGFSEQIKQNKQLRDALINNTFELFETEVSQSILNKGSYQNAFQTYSNGNTPRRDFKQAAGSAIEAGGILGPLGFGANVTTQIVGYVYNQYKNMENKK